MSISIRDVIGLNNGFQSTAIISNIYLGLVRNSNRKYRRNFALKKEQEEKKKKKEKDLIEERI